MLNALVTLAAEEAEHNPLLPAMYDIVWSAVCFVIIAIVIVAVAIPRLNKVFDARSAAIEGNIEKADEAQRQAEAALAEYTQQLADARREAGEIREGARVDGKKIVDEARATAQAEAERISVSAQTQIEAERQAAMISLRQDVGSIALDLAGNVIGETMNEDAKAQAVVDRFIAELEASEKAAQ